MKDRREIGKNYHNQIFEVAGENTTLNGLHYAALQIGNTQFLKGDERIKQNLIEENFVIGSDSMVAQMFFGEGSEEVKLIGNGFDFTAMCHMYSHIATDTFHYPLEEVRRVGADLGLYHMESTHFGATYLRNFLLRLPDSMIGSFESIKPEFVSGWGNIEYEFRHERIGEHLKATRDMARDYYVDGIKDVPLIKKKVEENEFALTPENFLDAFVRGSFARVKIINGSEYKEKVFSGIEKVHNNPQKLLYSMSGKILYTPDSERELAWNIAQDKPIPNSRVPFTTTEIKNVKELTARMRDEILKIT